MKNWTLLLCAALALGACNDKGDTGDTSVAGDDTSATGDDTSSAADGFSISGTAVDLLSGSAAATGLCVQASDPSAVLSGGDLEILVEGTVGDAGAYSVEGVVTDSTLGLLMLVQDCADEGTVMPTATGIGADDYSGLGAGDAITDRTIYSLDGASQASFQAGLAAAGYTGDLAVDGALLGFVLDSAGTPIDGATVAGSASDVVYYFDGAGFNTTGTAAAAGGLFIIPAGGIYSYSATADGYSFDGVLAGSQPGFAVIIAFNAI